MCKCVWVEDVASSTAHTQQCHTNRLVKKERNNEKKNGSGRVGQRGEWREREGVEGDAGLYLGGVRLVARGVGRRSRGGLRQCTRRSSTPRTKSSTSVGHDAKGEKPADVPGGAQ